MDSNAPITIIPQMPDLRDMTPPRAIVTDECLLKARAMVTEWLANKDEDSMEVLCEGGGDYPHLYYFFRYVINARECSNSWSEVHVAVCCLWPETYAVNRRTVCDNHSCHDPRNGIDSEKERFHDCNLDPIVLEAARVVAGDSKELFND